MNGNTAVGRRRLIRAARQLREADIPRRVLSPQELAAFRPDQWPLLIRQAGHIVRVAALIVSPAQRFREAYLRERALEGDVTSPYRKPPPVA